jgi:RNA polymerase sigma-70 factor (ECF subfamily)
MALTFESFSEDYVRRLADGDSDAGEHFASYFGAVLLLKLRVRLRSTQAIEDVRQETLSRVLAVLRQGRGIQRPERFGAFVNGVCDNVIRELGRHGGNDESWEDNKWEPADPTTENPDAGLMRADLKREVAHTLAQLSEKERRILQAIYLDEIEKTEICRLFQVNSAYLRVLVHRARVRFRQVYCECRQAGPWSIPLPVNPHRE